MKYNTRFNNLAKEVSAMAITGNLKGLTLAQYRTLEEIVRELSKDKLAVFFDSTLAKFISQRGFHVSPYDEVNYIAFYDC